MLFERLRSARKLQGVAATCAILLIAGQMIGPPNRSANTVEAVRGIVETQATSGASQAPKGPESDKPSAQALDNWSSNPFPYLYQVEVVATGYFAGKESTGKNPGHPEYGITYSGVKVRKDKFSTIAADPSVFPLGTVMYIPGYGYGVVADTGGAIKGNKIDLFFETKDQIYKEWGKRTVKVNVLVRGDGKVTEAMLDRLNALTPVMANRP